MSEDLMLKCLIVFVLGFLVARMMRGNGLMIGGENVPVNYKCEVTKEGEGWNGSRYLSLSNVKKEDEYLSFIDKNEKSVVVQDLDCGKKSISGIANEAYHQIKLKECKDTNFLNKCLWCHKLGGKRQIYDKPWLCHDENNEQINEATNFNTNIFGYMGKVKPLEDDNGNPIEYIEFTVIDYSRLNTK